MVEQRSAPDFLFENVGSHGDVMPLLSIAGELVRRGHRCQLLANEHFRAEAAARGVGFYANAHERTHGEIQGEGVVSYFYLKADRIREYFQQPGAFHERTVMVHSNAFGGSEPLAEAYRLRTVELTLFPVRIRSSIAPAWPIGARACGPDREQFLKVTLPAMYRAADRHPAVLSKINSVRTPLGLAPVSNAQYERSHVVARAAMFPEWFGMPAADWPQLECLGFPLPSSDQPLPAPVQEFLARCPRPVVFTTGTGCGSTERFFDAAAACCAELGVAGIFLSSFLAAGRVLGDRIARFEYVELEQLLPHVAAIVHHGGMGTTARGLQAGIPQVISPIGFDQPDNGHRVEVLGVGRVVPREQMSGATFAAALRELLADPAVALQLSRHRAALQGSRAVERAADLLESVARSSARAA